MTPSFLPSFLRLTFAVFWFASEPAWAAGVCSGGAQPIDGACCRRSANQASVPGGPIDFTDVPVYLNAASFGAYGTRTYNCPLEMGTGPAQQFSLSQLRGQLEWAIGIWNRGGAKMKFRYAGEVPEAIHDGCDTSHWFVEGWCTPVVVSMGCMSVAGRQAEASGYCGSSVKLNGHYTWATQWSNVTEIGPVLVHELGHTLGRVDEDADFCDPMNPAPPGQPCAGSDPASVMGYGLFGPYSYQVVTPGLRAQLWNRDVYSLRHAGGPNGGYGYGERQNRRVRSAYSTNGFASTYSLNDEPVFRTNDRPANAFGEGAYHVAAAKAASTTYGDNDIYAMRGDGVTWSAWTYLGSWTVGDLSMAYGGGVFVLLHVAADNSRKIYYQLNQGTGSWTSPSVVGDGAWSELSIASVGPPAIQWHPFSNQFVLTWTRRGTYPNLCAASVGVCWLGWPLNKHVLCNWRSPQCQPESVALPLRAPIGAPALANYFGAAYQSLQQVVYPALSTAVPLIRSASISTVANDSPYWNQDFQVVLSSGGTANLGAAHAPSGAYRHVLTHFDYDPTATARLRADGLDNFSVPPFSTSAAWTQSLVDGAGHLTYGTPWNEFAFVYGSYWPY